ncbi:MAG: microcin ABC transporter ATP-binding protein, partial [Mesorhizobium sp.]
KPKLLIADEPTTALDVVLQAQILDLLRDLVSENRMGLLLISHDLAVVTEMADRLTILRRGEVMEAGDTARTLSEQLHPYTRELALASMHVPARPKTHLAGSAKPLLEVESVSRDYPGRRKSLFRPAA